MDISWNLCYRYATLKNNKFVLIDDFEPYAHYYNILYLNSVGSHFSKTAVEQKDFEVHQNTIYYCSLIQFGDL